ncbi:GRB2-associated-binding protein 2 [Cricetulus griseus]|nr:GRB2-associated-binding protein 2 [Cricetulus griseus]
MSCSSSQYCRSISNTDSRVSENYVPMQNPMTSSPVSSGTNSQAPKRTTSNVNYIALDFQPVSQSPYCEPSSSSVTLDKDAAVLKTLQRCQAMLIWSCGL